MTELASGSGPLFMDPDPEAARSFFRGKSRALTDKVMPIKEAVARFVQDGDYVASGGFGADRIPTAAIHEILRQKKRNLFASLCWRTLVMTQHDRRRFVDKLDFVTYIIGR